MKRESDLLYEKWKTRKQEREKERGEEEQRRKTTKLCEKKFNGKRKRTKTRKSGSGNQRTKTGQSVSERGGKRNVHQHERRNKNNL